MTISKTDEHVALLIELALEQGWTVNPVANGSKLIWKSPDKSVPPVTTPIRVQGRGVNNIQGSLSRAGLDLSSIKHTKAKPTEIADGAPLPTYTELLIDASLVFGLDESQINQIIDNTNDDSPESRLGRIIAIYKKNSDEMLGLAVAELARLVSSIAIDDKVAGEAIEAMDQLEVANKRILKLEAERTDALEQLKTEAGLRVEAQERALKAENKLKAFRAALADD